MRHFLSICFALIASCLPALAQSGSNIRQSGNVTPGHAWAVTTNGIAQDAGTAAVPFLTSIGTVGQGQTICAWTALSTAPGSQKLCLGVNDLSAATLTLQNYGIDTPQGLNFVINGVTYPFPYTVGGVVGPGSSTSGDAACWNNTSGSLLKDCGGGVDINYLKSKTANYQIAATDCGSTIQAGTGSTGQFTVTLPVVSGFDAQCSVLIKNNDTTNAKILSGFPADMDVRLWPGQTVGIKIVNGAWATFNNPGRWQLTGNVVLYVNGSGGSATCGTSGQFTCSAGNDNNDGLTVTTPFNTLQAALNIILAHIDANGNSPQINVAHSSTTNNQLVCIGGPFVGIGVIKVTGDSTAKTAVTVVDPSGGYGLQVKDLCTLEYDNIAFADAGTNDAAGHILVGGTGNSGHFDFSGLTWGGLTVGTMLTVSNLGSSGATGTTAITGGAPVLMQAVNGGLIDMQGQSITIGSAQAFTATGSILSGGIIRGVTNTTFSGAGVAATTGIRAQILGGGSWLQAGGNSCNSVFPGNSNCLLQQGGQDDAVDLQTSAYPLEAASVTNAKLANPATTVDGQTCTLGSTCTTTIAAQSDYTATTWTPTITTDSTVGTPAYTTHTGTYEQLGRQVTVRFNITLSGWTGSPTGNVSIAGLPVADAGNYGVCTVGFYTVTGLAASNIGISGLIPDTASAIVLYQNSNTTSTKITAAQIGTTATLIGFCNYHT